MGVRLITLDTPVNVRRIFITFATLRLQTLRAVDRRGTGEAFLMASDKLSWLSDVIEADNVEMPLVYFKVGTIKAALVE